jgi:hypothetical protein
MQQDKNARLAQALHKYAPRSGDITKCDECDVFCLTQHAHVYDDAESVRRVCPDCDLPPSWHMGFSEKRDGKHYFVRFDPVSGQRHTQWGHPTVGNPLHVSGDVGESSAPTKRARRS